jgi:hypothetical protein
VISTLSKNISNQQASHEQRRGTERIDIGSGMIFRLALSTDADCLPQSPQMARIRGRDEAGDGRGGAIENKANISH